MNLSVFTESCRLSSEDDFFFSEYESAYRVANVPAHGVVVYLSIFIPSQVNNLANICENSLILLKPVVERRHGRNVVNERDVGDFLRQLSYHHVRAAPSYGV